MATNMTRNGVSTTTQPGQEQYETFYSARLGRKVTKVMYDYRDWDGELFSTVAPTLKECRERKQNWLNRKSNPALK